MNSDRASVLLFVLYLGGYNVSEGRGLAYQKPYLN